MQTFLPLIFTYISIWAIFQSDWANNNPAIGIILVAPYFGFIASYMVICSTTKMRYYATSMLHWVVYLAIPLNRCILGLVPQLEKHPKAEAGCLYPEVWVISAVGGIMFVIYMRFVFGAIG